MSIEYTIDIQLTELGFPDILQQQESATRETPSQSPSALPSTHKRKLSHNEADPPTQTLDIKQSKVPRNGPIPAQSVQDKQHAAVSTELPGLSEPKLNAVETTDVSLHNSREEAGQNGTGNGETAEAEENIVEDDSDDTEVSDVYDEEEMDEEEDSDQDDDSSNSVYCCSVCDLKLPSKFKLQDHMNLHTGARPYCCAECGKRFCQKNNYRVHLRVHAQTNRLVCRICQRGFTTQQQLEDHLSRIHTEEQFYECDLCKRVFTRLKECESHVQLHKCVLDAVCNVCGRNFSSRKSLARHRKTTCHRNLKCTDCCKTFTKKNALLKHSFTHLGLLPYTCIRCHCHFRLAKLYRQHKCEPERIHCVACLREFLSQDDFKQHKKDTGCWGNQEPKGDEIRCLECGETFDNSEELKKHAGAHQRVLKCAECGKGFRSALLLMSHMGGHAGKSPCLCQSCGLGFPHQQNYDSHLKTCGKTPQPARAPKKHQASKRSSSSMQNHPQKNLSAIPNTSAPTNQVTAADLNKPATPVKESVHPGPVMGEVSNGVAKSDGLWKLTLDKQPPPGAQLVLYLPVCPAQTNNLPISPVVSGYLGMNAPLGLQLTSPPNLVTEIKQDPGCKGPLDLSKKCNPSTSVLSNIPIDKIKKETEEYEISGEANSDMNVKAAIAIKVKTEEDKDAGTMKTETDPSLHTSSELIVNIKKEPDTHGLDIPEAGK